MERARLPSDRRSQPISSTLTSAGKSNFYMRVADTMNAKQVLEFIKKNDIVTVDLRFTDWRLAALLFSARAGSSRITIYDELTSAKSAA